ncbi:unnamed protein product, partial [Bubo scandiacus]
RGGRCPIHGNIQGQAGWGSEQPDRVEDVPAHCRVFCSRCLPPHPAPPAAEPPRDANSSHQKSFPTRRLRGGGGSLADTPRASPAPRGGGREGSARPYTPSTPPPPPPPKKKKKLKKRELGVMAGGGWCNTSAGACEPGEGMGAAGGDSPGPGSVPTAGSREPAA